MATRKKSLNDILVQASRMNQELMDQYQSNKISDAQFTQKHNQISNIVNRYSSNIVNTQEYQREQEKYVREHTSDAPNNTRLANQWRRNFFGDYTANGAAYSRKYSRSTYMGINVG